MQASLVFHHRPKDRPVLAEPEQAVAVGAALLAKYQETGARGVPWRVFALGGVGDEIEPGLFGVDTEMRDGQHLVVVQRLSQPDSREACHAFDQEWERLKGKGFRFGVWIEGKRSKHSAEWRMRQFAGGWSQETSGAFKIVEDWEAITVSGSNPGG